jgi:hypothetical protein
MRLCCLAASLLLLSALIPPAASASCSIAGLATGFLSNGDPLFDTYRISASNDALTATCLSGPDPDAIVSSVCGWTTAKLEQLDSAITVTFDTGKVLTGSIDCSSTTSCGWTQTSPTCPQNWAPDMCSENAAFVQNSPAPCASITFSDATRWVLVREFSRVHLVFMNHLDVGYNGIPITGFINNILNIYFHQHFPRAVSVAATMRATSKRRFIYTTHPWLVSLYLDCPTNMILSAIPLVCPSPDQVASFRAAVAAGDITWHRGPFNMQPENLASSHLFEMSLDLSTSLSEQFGMPNSTIMSQRDVPGLTRGVIPLLSDNGVSAITVGVNDYTCPPDVPKAFVWRDLASGKDIIALFHAYGCMSSSSCSSSFFCLSCFTSFPAPRPRQPRSQFLQSSRPLPLQLRRSGPPV